MIMEFFCYCCGDDLSCGENKKRRRILSKASKASEACKTLISLVHGVVKSRVVDTSRLHTGYVCRNCLGLLERYQNLQKQLEHNIRTALQVLPTTDGSTISVEEVNSANECSTSSVTASALPTQSDKSPQVLKLFIGYILYLKQGRN